MLIAVYNVLNTTLGSHLATLGLRFGLGWGGVGYALVALGAVRPVVAVLDGVDVALTHTELPISMSTPGDPGARTHVPTASRGRGPDTLNGGEVLAWQPRPTAPPDPSRAYQPSSNRATTGR